MQVGSRGERDIRNTIEQPRTLFGVNIGRFDPAAMPASLWADTRKAANRIKRGDDATSALVGLGNDTFSAVIQRNFLDGFASLFRREFDDNGREKGLAQKYGENAAEAMMPLRSVVRSTKQLTDPVKDQPGKGIAEGAYGSGRDARNLMGEPQRVRADGDTWSAIGQLFAYPTAKPSPTATYWMATIHKANAEIERAGGNPSWPGYPSRSYEERGERRRWSDAEYDAITKESGSRWLGLLEQNREEIDRMEPERQVKRIMQLREIANRQARNAVKNP
jgi:hypothetical protein